MTDIAPVADNTTLVKKKFPVNEENNTYIDKYTQLLEEYEEIFDYQTQQINHIKDKSSINNLKNLYILYSIYDNIGQTLFEFKNELQEDNPDINTLLQDRIILNTLLGKLLVQMELYIKNLKNTTTVNIDKEDIDQYDMLVPSDKKDWLVNMPF